MKKVKYALIASLILLASLLIVPATLVNAQETNINLEIIPSVGGTTDPVPGGYAFPEGTQYTLTATPNPGFVFDHWIVSGDLSPHTPGERVDQALVVYDNPIRGDCGFGYTYQFQAVFVPEGASAALPNVSGLIVVIMGIVAVVVGALVAIGAYTLGKRRK